MAQNIQQGSEFNYSRKQIVMGVISIFAVYGAMAYFVQTLTIARPKMAAELNGMSLYAWAVSIPSLFSAFATLIIGKFSDMYGRRIMLMIALIVSVIGTVLSAISPNFVFLIVASVIAAIGSYAMMPLVFAVVGDLFPPEKRGKWIGLLNIPTGIFSLIGPTMGGWFVDNLSWRYLFWLSLPLLVVCLITVPIGVPSIRSAVRGKIDYIGCLLVAVASSTTIIGLSFAGDRYPWASKEVVGLLAVALLFWILFFRAEASVQEPILDPLVLRNRSFLTVAVAALLSFFGQMGMLMYFPMFLQGVQDISAMRSGQMITPMSVLMSFIGVPVGFLLSRSKRFDAKAIFLYGAIAALIFGGIFHKAEIPAAWGGAAAALVGLAVGFLLSRSRRFKWMYILSYGTATLVMFGIIFLSAETPAAWGVVAACLAGLGMGAIPTLNTMVIQNAVPKRLLGVAMSAFFFCTSMGIAISPAVLGSAMNATYNKKLVELLPRQLNSDKLLAAAGDSSVLLNKEHRAALESDFEKEGKRDLFAPTVAAIRRALEAGVHSVFWVGAITMLLSFALICTIPSNSLDSKPEEGAGPDTAA